MKRIGLLKIFSITIAIIGSSFILSSTTAQAKGFTWLKTKDYSANPPLYKAKTPKRSVTIWNKNHTKKLHNLRNYPNTKWSVVQSVKMYNPKKTKGNKTGIYYKLVKNNKYYGYVHRNFLQKVEVKTKKTPATNSQSIIKQQNQTMLSLFTGTIEITDKFLDTEAAGSQVTRINTDKNDLLTFEKVKNHEMSYRDYVLSVLKAHHINPLNYSGMGIVVGSYDPNVLYDYSSNDEDYFNVRYLGGIFSITIAPLNYWSSQFIKNK